MAVLLEKVSWQDLQQINEQLQMAFTEEKWSRIEKLLQIRELALKSYCHSGQTPTKEQYQQFLLVNNRFITAAEKVDNETKAMQQTSRNLRKIQKTYYSAE